MRSAGRESLLSLSVYEFSELAYDTLKNTKYNEWCIVSLYLRIRDYLILTCRHFIKPAFLLLSKLLIPTSYMNYNLLIYIKTQNL